ncbi:MAG: transglutaminase-like cysteine peptidase [Proteobacteria bacterium]|nr:transglutaminase-like cysteine peptidase [Pseudomonadota bacterium]MBU1232000.1 transglutaminase-like cysteine peptidase [Pseudomonadota bacterium]MBU1418725.1 transglutaminase-like cysteine peptidase [Pseudomonadota bacterium]MBU1454471.1 transglutaminase-like cysteine peptidase [Pseudomonadota bacterium]
MAPDLKLLSGYIFCFANPQRWILLALCFFIVAIVAFPGTALSAGDFTLDQSILNAAEKKYNHMAVKRLLAWQDLIRNNQSISETKKLEKVNHFFNSIDFVEDAIHWKQKDYWATPVEFIASDGGDCEDFSLAKYFTLKALGVSEKKLNLTYVKALELNQAHMVLTYYSSPAAEPLILDNLIQEIRPASQRKDLMPVYSFNGLGLWIAKERGQGQMVGSSDRLTKWQGVLQRMPDGLQ